MDFEKFQKWQQYFLQRPVGWRDDLRAYKMMTAWGVKESSHDIFDSLKSMREAESEHSAGNALKGTKILQFMVSSKGGDSLEL